MRIVLSLIVLIHGLIHFMGFARAFALVTNSGITKEVSKPIGLLWLLSGLLFMVSAIMMFLNKAGWPVLVIPAVIVSQGLILTVWSDAKFGTIANSIVLLVAVIGVGMQQFEKSYKTDVKRALDSDISQNEIITEKDLEPLPPIVQNYLRYVGLLGTPKLHNIKIVFEGEMRDKGKDWFSFNSEQYNFFDSPTRLFFMKAKLKSLPVNGYHRYVAEGASMQIKFLSLFSVVDIDGPELYPTETVTFFNDLCLFAPAALIDKRITWESLDDRSVKAVFTTNNTRISAVLYFNGEGQLVRFTSGDRMVVSEMKNYPFSTPVSNYKNINDYTLPTYGEGVWHYPDGEFVYGKFNVKSIEYNVEGLK